MAKGSQLSQLKAALSQAGLTGNHTNGKKRTRAISDKEKDRAKKAAKLQEIQQKLNPFDVKVTKVKHDVGGRKIRGVSGRPAQSKQAGLEQRKRTLLKEYEEKGHAGGIIDRRFGENDPTMSIEERMLERFTKERQRASRAGAFNLEDEDELTHYGQSLSNLDDFDNAGLTLEDDDDEDPGQISREAVEKAHFGGFEDESDHEDEPERKKSKAEVMAEVIAKSKEHKMLRQIEKERDENIRHQLDEDFDSIRDLLYSQKPSVADVIPSTTVTAEPTTETPATIDADYDQRVRELAFDQRAKPKDRTKTDEEIALEQKEQLEKAERRRRKRMLGLEDSEDEDGQPKAKRRKGGDDLDDDFHEEVEEEWDGLGNGLGGQPDHGEEEDDGEAESSEDDDEDQGGDEEDDDDSQDSEDEEGELGEHDTLVPSRNEANRPKPKTSSELPFTFECPSSHDEFLEIVDGLDDGDVPTVVQRIRVLHHPSLSPDNKHKLQVLNHVLIDYVLYITSPPSPRFGLLTSLLPHLLALSRSYPTQSAEYFVAKLRLMHQNLRRGVAKGPLDPEAKTWPGIPELTLLRVIGAIWPTSDLNHIVVSPTRLLMGAYLGLGRVRSISDIASGLFLSTLLLQYEQVSKRLVPEALSFSVAVVLHLAHTPYVDAASVPGTFALPDFRADACRVLALDAKKAKDAVIRKTNILALLSNASSDQQVKVDLLNTSLDLIGRFADLYKGLDGFIELFDPVRDILEAVETKRLPACLKTSLSPLQDRLKKMLHFARQSRQPLLLQVHKPIPIATYIPKFESSSSSYMRRQDPDRERNEAAKLRNQYKEERKGAIRELRKDARFLATVEQEKQKEKDRAYHERMKRVFGSLEGERAEQKAMEREKAKDKRRSGRK
ncbi:nucleolar complex protein 14 [Pleurotus ostreatus]|uniref:Nucleolar complex protein 14 n=1 Tax=Pleurotus ostreatus TaxID=5322 RepID=A0A8H6ZXR2_PLEOS|nr:nucleolar complex protein 14 [Pleurotus ostreatus]KAF7432764.1 nucleolar complex protein 14 [Pleurotus ostreatus]KAJ8698697.1 nucleolar complex protein 14 [Pleurotus ostreatus]